MQVPKKSKVQMLVAGAQMMSPRLAQRFAEQKQAAANRTIKKPDLAVKKPPVTFSKMGNQVRPAQTLRPDPDGNNPGPSAIRRPGI